MAGMIPLLALLLPLPVLQPESAPAAPQGAPVEPAWQALFPDGEIGEWRVVGGDGEYSFEEEGGWPVLYGRGATGRQLLARGVEIVVDLEAAIKAMPPGQRLGRDEPCGAIASSRERFRQ